MSNKVPYGLYAKAAKQFIIPVYRRGWILGLPYGADIPVVCYRWTKPSASQ